MSETSLEKNNVFLFDSQISTKSLMHIKQNDIVISFDFNTHKILENNQIIHKRADTFLSKSDLEEIQNYSYHFSMWYDNEQISSEITFKGINIGELFYVQLNDLLISFLRKFLQIKKIFNAYTNSNFIASKTLFDIMYTFTKSTQLLDEHPSDENNSIFNFVEIPLKLGKLSIPIRIKNSHYKKIKKIYDRFFNLIDNPISINSNYPTILLLNFTTLKHKKFFLELPNYSLNVIKFDSRIPAFWNRTSFSVIKKSKCIIENFDNLKDREFQQIINNEFKNFVSINKFIEQNNSFFQNFFAIKEDSFWASFKSLFLHLCTQKWYDAIHNIILFEKLFKKYAISKIVILDESGFDEQILLKLGKKHGITTILIQHGLYYLTDERFGFENFRKLFSKESDYFLTWGKKEENFALKKNIPKYKIKKIGCPFYDDLFDQNELHNFSKKYILLAADAPNSHTSFETTIEAREKYENVIKEVCRITKKLNKKLVIKLHPSKYIGENLIAKSVDSDIEVHRTGDIEELIENCEIMLVTNFSSVIIESQILKKPVISISTYSHNGTPEIFSNNSCIETTIENLEELLHSFLSNECKMQEQIQKGTHYAYDHLSNPKSATLELLKFLES